MHHLTFEYVKASEAQLAAMSRVRQAFAACAGVVLAEVPDGPDRTFVLRQLRDCSMWANVAVTRHPDGSPRT